MFITNTMPSPAIAITLPELASNRWPAFVVCTAGFELVVPVPVADATSVVTVVEPMADIPEGDPIPVVMLPDIDTPVAVEFPPAKLVLFAFPVALPLVPPVAGELLPIAAMVLVAVASAPPLAVLPFVAFVFVAIVVVESCAATVQAMRAARRMDENRILDDVDEVCEISE